MHVASMRWNRIAATATAAAVLLAVFSTSGCGGSDEPPIDLTSFTRPYEYLENGRPTSNWDFIWPDATYVVRGATDFSNAWLARKYGGNAPSPVPTTVDFSKVTLLGISQGGGPGCFHLRITRARQVEATLQVESELAVPDPTVGCTGQVLPVFDFVQIPKTDLPVKFLPTKTVTKPSPIQ